MTGMLFSADLQTEYENLDLLKKVEDQWFEYADKKRIQALVLLGDLKSRYNPIDVRVVNAMVYLVKRFTDRKVQVLVNCGNHDRVGMYNDRETWLPILQEAGAEVFTEPGVVQVNQVSLYFLPFRSSVEQLKEGAQDLKKLRKKNTDAECHVLCFHADLSQAQYNVSTESRSKLSVDELFPQEYDYVVGGHIHMFQRVKYPNVFYVGSPFPMDWGEVNSQKGFMLLEI